MSEVADTATVTSPVERDDTVKSRRWNARRLEAAVPRLAIAVLLAREHGRRLSPFTFAQRARWD